MTHVVQKIRTKSNRDRRWVMSDNDMREEWEPCSQVYFGVLLIDLLAWSRFSKAPPSGPQLDVSFHRWESVYRRRRASHGQSNGPLWSLSRRLPWYPFSQPHFRYLWLTMSQYDALEKQLWPSRMHSRLHRIFWLWNWVCGEISSRWRITSFNVTYVQLRFFTMC